MCADLSAKPFASVKVVKPGYFALVMPRTEAEAFLAATYSHPTDGTSTREHPLGVVGERVNGVILDFSPEETPAAEGETIPPDVAKALEDLFRKAEEAQADFNDMISDSLSDIF
jgi:hypothetical protein